MSTLAMIRDIHQKHSDWQRHANPYALFKEHRTITYVEEFGYFVTALYDTHLPGSYDTFEEAETSFEEKA